ncbi:MAG: LPPG:FO 2-phospho-L-lactate transferase [Gammaproteobacteria bacterium]|jgi:LPPG:FO 2-phospho-L-lactate transferase
MKEAREKYLAVSGGVGGAKLCLGLASILSADNITFVVNTGDDFEHLGLHISPDLDTLTYTLAGLSNREMGWGRQGETWNFIAALKQFGGESWFNLGDSDLAIHVMRTQMLNSGATLTKTTAALTNSVGIKHTILPMSDDPVRTIVHSDSGDLAFQHYFVRDRCEPNVKGFSFRGSESATISKELRACLDDPDLAGVVICPSNPYVSIDPLFAVAEFRDWVQATSLPVIAISPIVGGEAIKGPTAKMMRELSVPASPTAVAKHYVDKIDGFVIDECDADFRDEIAALGLETIVAQSVMVTLDDRIDLAQRAIDFLRRLNRGN